MYEKYEKIICYCLMGLTGISLLILMCLGLFNHPTGDDYYYAVATKWALEESGSIWQMFEAAAKGVADQYIRWQGTYSAMFLMYLPPNVFFESAYKLVTFLILSIYTGGVFYLLKPIFCTILKGSTCMWCAISAAFVLLTIQTVPFKGESFFWYNGSMYYTGYFSITLFFFGAMCRYLIFGHRYYVPILMILAVFLAGGNYVSILPSILVMVTVIVILIKKHSKKLWAISLVTILMIAGLLVSAAAPGNLVRGGGSIGNISALKAIVLSLWQSISYLEAWIDRWWLMTVILLTPLFWHTYKNISFVFPAPLLVVSFIHGIACSMSCPTFYAQGNTGPARVMAIVYYGFILSTLINYYYVLGWFYQWWKDRVRVQSLSVIEKRCLKVWSPHIVVIAVMLFLFAVQLYSGEFANCSSVQAAKALLSGEAAAYEMEYRERLKVLSDDSVKDVVFKPYEHQPTMLYVGDFTPDEENENNVEIAKYFHKDSIKVELMD